jgi:DNA end-binding protein Ku
MAGDFDPTQFTDEYREALESVIEAKVEGREVVQAAEPETSGGGEVVDLMAALRASVDAAKRGRAGHDTVAADKRPVAKKAAPAPVKKATKAVSGATRKAAAPRKQPAKATRAKKPA